ncbi:hypothetical protein AKJ51_03510 [candidate division MSBL1 archaeon SCGC-AAA382A20]|uniref:DUF1156 domain-containing protein n=1 Tax=candidate division MSBL1 archaeon SCGC-AAA382A20 TaxID=1698280 RepID=A0A133VJB6_9EURY|nr:hypothetical protein AKJ51_03510 [candidate division MSBL1 archaeon SCGC-AAA382A20]
MSNQNRDKRLIEVDMPLEKISEESRREKNIRHGNPSTIHIWWARRPLSISRTSAYASLIKDPETEEERQNEIEFVKKLSTWEATTDSNTLSTARQKIRKNFDGRAPRILDPFSGGGALPLEAQRIGSKAHALELNPVAHILDKSVMKFPYEASQKYNDTERKREELMVDRRDEKNKLANDVEKWADWVLKEAKKEIGDLYTDDVIGYIWARTLPCQNPDCDMDIPLIRQFWLNSRDNSRKAIYTINADKNGNIEIEIHHEDEFEVFTEDNKKKVHVHDTDEVVVPSEGTVQRGSVSCPACNNSFKSKRTRELSRNKGFGRKLMVIVEKGENKGKSYRVPKERDTELFESAEEKLNQIEDELIPDESLPPEGSLGIRVNLYEYDNWGQLFNARQKLALATFCKKVNETYDEISKKEDEEYAKAVCTYLGLAIDKMADYNSKITSWLHHRESVRNTFTRGALPIRWDYVETNPFSGATGDWTSALDWITRVIETCSYVTGEPETRLGDATRLPYPDNHFDAVLTDPPYYNNMPYASTSDYFYVWLKRSIGDLYPDVFSTPLTPKNKEIIQDKSRHKSKADAKEFFEQQLTKAFKEINRVLKDDGICTIVFAHKSTTAWAQMIRSLLSSGLVATATWPIHTEMHNRPRGLESAALASSVYFVCRKRGGSEIGYHSDVQEELKETVHKKLDYFWNQGTRGADLLVSAIGPAVEVFGKYEKVKRLSGEEVKVDELLEDTQRIVSDYALGKVLEGDIGLGDIDAETRFYLLFRWAFANQKEDYDEIRKLAQVNDANTDRLEETDILKVTRGDARIQPPQKRDFDEPEKVPEKNSLSLIEKIQRAAILWEEGRRSKLKSFVKNYCMEEEFWRTAQAIAECLPEEGSRNKKEKRMLHGLLNYGGQTEFDVETGQLSLDKF